MLGDVFGKHEHVGDMRGRGLFLGIELVKPGKGAADPLGGIGQPGAPGAASPKGTTAAAAVPGVNEAAATAVSDRMLRKRRCMVLLRHWKGTAETGSGPRSQRR